MATGTERASWLVLPLLLWGSSALANSTCRDDWLCIDEVRRGEKVELIARNLQDFPLTFTIRVKARRGELVGAGTVTRTLWAGQSQKVMDLASRDGGRNPAYRIFMDWTVGDRFADHDDDYLYALPYGDGSAYRILQGFGSRFSHRGLEEFAIDFDMPVGTPVHAARDGVVARVVEDNDKGCWEDGCGRWANYVVVLHSDGTTGEYYHLARNGAAVAVGDRVTRGQHIGFSGNTGHTTMPHLHFAVYRASAWGSTQSIPIRLQSADGIIHTPRRGGRHQAAH